MMAKVSEEKILKGFTWEQYDGKGFRRENIKRLDMETA